MSPLLAGANALNGFRTSYLLGSSNLSGDPRVSVSPVPF